MKRSTIVSLSIACLLSVHALAQSRQIARGQTADFRLHDTTVRITLTPDARASVAFGGPEGLSLPVVLPKPFSRIDSVAASRDFARLAIVGESDGAGTILVLDRLKRQIVTDLPAIGVSVSPNGHVLAFERFHPRGSATYSAYYSVVDLDGFLGGGSLRQPLAAFFPSKTVAVHQRLSDLQWVDENTLAFVDLSGDKAAVVAARFKPSGMVSQLETRELDTESLVIAARVDGDGPPASALYGARISRLPGKGLALRLTFPDNTALKVRRLDIQMWND